MSLILIMLFIPECSTSFWKTLRYIRVLQLILLLKGQKQIHNGVVPQFLAKVTSGSDGRRLRRRGQRPLFTETARPDIKPVEWGVPGAAQLFLAGTRWRCMADDGASRSGPVGSGSEPQGPQEDLLTSLISRMGFFSKFCQQPLDISVFFAAKVLQKGMTIDNFLGNLWAFSPHFHLTFFLNSGCLCCFNF